MFMLPTVAEISGYEWGRWRDGDAQEERQRKIALGAACEGPGSDLGQPAADCPEPASAGEGHKVRLAPRCTQHHGRQGRRGARARYRPDRLRAKRRLAPRPSGAGAWRGQERLGVREARTLPIRGVFSCLPLSASGAYRLVPGEGAAQPSTRCSRPIPRGSCGGRSGDTSAR